MIKNLIAALLGIGATPALDERTLAPAVVDVAPPLLSAQVERRAAEADAPPSLQEALKAAAAYQDDRASKLFDMLKSLSLVDTAPRSLIGRPIRAAWSYDNAVCEGLKASTWVYACIFKIAQSAGSVKWHAERENPDGTWSRDDKAPLSRLLAKPNALWTGAGLVERVVYSLFLGGEAYVTKLRGIDGLPFELWAHTPRDVSPIPGEDALIESFEFKVSGKPTRYVKARDCIQIIFPDPSNHYRGLSPLQVAAAVVDSDSAAAQWNKSAVANRAVVDGVLSFKHDLSEEQHLSALEMLERSYSGPDNARRPLVVGNEASFTPMSLSPVEMDFLNGRKMNREEICAIFGVPTPLVGIMDHATYSNYSTARDVFWLDTMVPLLDDVAEALTAGLAAEFGAGWRVAYDTSSIAALHKIGADRIQAATALHKIGVPLAVLNDRFKLGLPPCPDDGLAFVNGQPVKQLLEGAAAAQGAAFPAFASRAQVNAARSLLDATQAILLRVREGKATDEDLAVVDELTAELEDVFAALRGGEG